MQIFPPLMRLGGLLCSKRAGSTTFIICRNISLGRMYGEGDGVLIAFEQQGYTIALPRSTSP